jgi:NAD(P)-dependent dehydrogenase (short-subunit alcohol dehydrogenase family)
MSGRLQDRVAIVTGGGSGLGREISLLYAAEGARVVVSDIRSELGEETVALVTGAGGTASFVPANVAKEADVAALVRAAEERYGRLQIMAANAGTLGRGHRKLLVDLQEDEVREVMDINFFGVYYSFRQAAPAIQRAGGGAMIAVSSTSALRGMASLSAYSASKGAVAAFVRAVAAELAPMNIRVNTLIAGPMATQLHRHLTEDRGEDPSQAPQSAPDRSLGIAHPREVAQVALFLVSDEASFVTGEAYRADGGRSNLAQTMGAVQARAT